MAAHADGEAFVAMSRGKIRLLAEGANRVRRIRIDRCRDQGDEPIEIRCALTKLRAENGRVKIDPLVMDTTDTKVTAKGEVDLASEKINMLVTPYSKDFSRSRCVPRFASAASSPIWMCSRTPRNWVPATGSSKS
jgi:AsmA family protein